VEGGALESRTKGVLVTPTHEANCLKILLDVTAQGAHTGPQGVPLD
jgi:hypothetical protein